MSIFEYDGDGSEDEATFFSLSCEFLEAAETLNRTPPTKINYWIVTYYLLGHSAELALKSFLFKKDISIKELKKVGHDLNSLIEKSIEHGLQDFVALRKLSPVYKSKNLEYRKRQREEFPFVDDLIQEVKQLQSIAFNNASAF